MPPIVGGNGPGGVQGRYGDRREEEELEVDCARSSSRKGLDGRWDEATTFPFDPGTRRRHCRQQERGLLTVLVGMLCFQV